MPAIELIFKITPRQAWEDARAAGRFFGAPVDKQDGFIHFSTADQLPETAARHFSNMDDLMLVAVNTTGLGDALKWEPSRDGALFPHLYDTLSMKHVVWERPMPIGKDGVHRLPLEVE